MARVTPQQAADKLIRRLQASGADITAGVNAVTEAPGVAAAASQERMLARLLESINSGEWAEAVSAVGVSEWKSAMINKGVPRISQGIAEARPQLERFFSQWLPHADTVSAEVDQMPNVTIEDSIARASHTIRRNHEFKYNKRT